MSFKRIKAAGLLLASSVPMARWVFFALVVIYLWQGIQLDRNLQFQVLVMGLPGLCLALMSRPLWRSENLRLVPGLPLAVCQCVLLVLSLLFVSVAFVKLLANQPLDMLLVHSAISLLLVLLARLDQGGIWLVTIAFLLNAHLLLELLGQWSHLPWVQVLFLAINFALVFCYYKVCGAGWSETDWYVFSQEPDAGTWFMRNERTARLIRIGSGGAAIVVVCSIWIYQVDHKASDLFLYYAGPLVVLGVPLIFLESIQTKMISWWITARDNTRQELGRRAMLSLYGRTLLVAAFFAAIALTGLIAFGKVNWLILSNLLLALTLAALFLGATVYYMNRLQRSGLYPLYVVGALVVLSFTLFWVAGLLPSGPFVTLVMAIVVVLVGTVSARIGGNALSRVEMF